MAAANTQEILQGCARIEKRGKKRRNEHGKAFSDGVVKKRTMTVHDAFQFCTNNCKC
jgi:hypothetical protein